ncbi:MAG: hypothetical protein AAF985_01930 [Bacteroidota bacterium]
MKEINLLVLLLSFTFGLTATNNDPEIKEDSQCRMDSAELNLCEDISHRIKSDLLAGIWSEKIESNSLNPVVARTYEFQAIGIVEVNTFYKDGQSELTRKIWRVSDVQNRAFLTLTDTGSDNPETFQMVQTCQGMMLKDKLLEKEVNWTVQ